MKQSDLTTDLLKKLRFHHEKVQEDHRFSGRMRPMETELTMLLRKSLLLIRLIKLNIILYSPSQSSNGGKSILTGPEFVEK